MKKNRLFAALAAAAMTLNIFGTSIMAEEPTQEPVVEVKEGFYQDDETGEIFLFQNDVMLKGWQKVDDVWYYLNPTTGALTLNDWVKDAKGNWYFVDVDGAMLVDTIFQTEDGNYYYVNEKGVMQKGWVKKNGFWYYFNSAMTFDWKKINNKWYYFGNNGQMRTGLSSDVNTGEVYLFSAYGDMMTGWQKLAGQWYYFGNAMKKACWMGKYYFDANGVMVTRSYVYNQEVGKFYWVDAKGCYVSKYTTTEYEDTYGYPVFDEPTGLPYEPLPEE